MPQFVEFYLCAAHSSGRSAGRGSLIPVPKKVVSFFIRTHNELLSVAMRVNDAEFRDQARDAVGQRPVVPL